VNRLFVFGREAKQGTGTLTDTLTKESPRRTELGVKVMYCHHSIMGRFYVISPTTESWHDFTQLRPSSNHGKILLDCNSPKIP